MNTSSFWFQGEPPNPLDPGSPIGNSLRFRGAQYLYTQILKETPSNQTWSFWLKLADPNNIGDNYITGDDSQGWGFGWYSGSGGYLTSNTAQGISNQTFRDPSAWYNLVITGNPTSSRQWMNGEEITGLTTLLPSAWQYSWKLLIGNLYPGQAFYFDGYMADVYFLESLVSGPEMFGRFNENGVWVPKDPEFPTAAVNSSFVTRCPSQDNPDYAGGVPLDLAYPTDPKKLFQGAAIDGTANAATSGSQSAGNWEEGWVMWQPPEGMRVTANTSIRVAYNYAMGDVNINGTNLGVSGGLTPGSGVDFVWVDVSDKVTFPITIEKMALRGGNLSGNGYYAWWNAIEIDGVVLSDQNIWSDQCYTYMPDSATGDPTPEMLASTEKSYGASPTLGFDGYTNTFAYTTGALAWLFRPTTPIKNVTNIKIINGGSELCWLNGVNTNTVGVGNDWNEIYNGPPITLETISSLYPTNWSPQAATTSAFSAIEINGTVLMDGQDFMWGPDGFHLTFADPSNIGKDYSGNGNDCTPTGFDTVPSTTWSRWLTCTGQGFHTQDTLDASAAFDWNNGNPNGVYALSLDNGATITFAPEIPVTYSSSLKVYVFGDNSTSVTLDGTTVSNVLAGAYAEFTGSGVISVDKPLTINGGTSQASLAVITIDEAPNAWTSGLYNTGGSDYDVMQDSPTDNYPTYNPLYQSVVSGFNTAQNYTDANLTAGTAVSGYHGTAFTTVPVLPKTYFEVTSGPIIAPYPILCFGLQNQTTIDDSVTVKYYQTGQCQKTNNALPAFTTGDVISLSFDQAANTLTSSVNGGPSTTFDLGTTFTLDDDVFFWVDCHTPSTATVNFGQQPFLYPITEGYTALHTSTMPAPTIYDGREEFRAITGSGGDGGLFYGNNATQCPTLTSPLNLTTAETIPTGTSRSFNSCTIDFGIQRTSGTVTFANFLSPIDVAISADGSNWRVLETGATIQPTYTATDGSDFRYARFWSSVAKNYAVSSTNAGSILANAQAIFPSGLWWIKDMVNSNQHQLVDSVRGTTSNTAAITCPASNPEATTYLPPAGDSVAWCWNASDPATNGFNILTWTGDGVDGRTIATGLTSPAEFVIYTNITTPNTGKNVYYKGVAPGSGMSLNTNTEEYAFGGGFVTVSGTNLILNEGSSNITVVNALGDDYVGYAWTSIPGYSAFGKYTGNNNTDGPFIYTGFSPAFILIKSTSSGAWSIYDSTRTPYNPSNDVLIADSTAGEDSSTTNSIDFLSNGFKLRNANNARNGSFNYIYAAFALNPFQSPVTAR